MPATVYFGGAFTDPTTVDLLRELQRVTGLDILLTQGSYSTNVSASGGTHDGGGVVDINVYGWTDSVIWDVLHASRCMGGVAWHRTPAQGFAYHIHLLRADCADLSPSARAQNVQYLAGQNGLANRGPDDGPRDCVGMTWAKYNGSSAYRPPINTGGGTSTDWLDMASEAEVRKIVQEEVTKALRAEGVSGAAAMTPGQNANGSYTVGSKVEKIVHDEVGHVLDVTGVISGVDAIRRKLGV
jgi:hypothetical protein